MPPERRGAEPAAARRTVVCLCADWCGTCHDYRSEFERLAARFSDHAFVWIDVEDDAALAEDFDVENFPTVLVMRGEEALFYGPVLPHVEQLSRLLTTLVAGGADTRVSAGVQTAAKRLVHALAQPG